MALHADTIIKKLFSLPNVAFFPSAAILLIQTDRPSRKTSKGWTPAVQQACTINFSVSRQLNNTTTLVQRNDTSWVEYDKRLIIFLLVDS